MLRNLFFNTKTPPEDGTSAQPELFLYNTLHKKKELFTPRKKEEVSVYTCGPTVYDYATIGNLRSYIFADILRRTLKYNGYTINHLINITDVGHLTDDADEGEDKMEKGALREGKTVQEIAQHFTDVFFDDIDALNIPLSAYSFPKATDHIPQQIMLVKTLLEKGYAYQTKDGIYFDTAKFRGYGALGGIDTKKLKAGARVKKNKDKVNQTDFALWKFSPKGQKRQQEWESPWGVGFPGWHIECTAMIFEHLGKQIDIHTGGIDHIPVHHNNEIAQAEASTGKEYVRYWLHGAFITIDNQRIGKSLGNTIRLVNIAERGISPLAYRYLILESHYRSPTNFTWESLEAAQSALFRLHRYFIEELGTKNGVIDDEYEKKFHTHINNDLDTPRALALVWKLIKDKKVSDEDKKATLVAFDTVLGLGLTKDQTASKSILSYGTVSMEELPEEIQGLIKKRELARKDKDWGIADSLRREILEAGYVLEDTPEGLRIEKKN